MIVKYMCLLFASPIILYSRYRIFSLFDNSNGIVNASGLSAFECALYMSTLIICKNAVFVAIKNNYAV